MKGTGYKTAVEDIDKVLALKHFRAETAQRAITSVLGYFGARRIEQICAAGHNEDLLVVSLLGDIEEAASRLDAIPQRTQFADARASEWAIICEGLDNIKMFLETEITLMRQRIKGEILREATVA